MTSCSNMEKHLVLTEVVLHNTIDIIYWMKYEFCKISMVCLFDHVDENKIYLKDDLWPWLTTRLDHT